MPAWRDLRKPLTRERPHEFQQEVGAFMEPDRCPQQCGQIRRPRSAGQLQHALGNCTPTYVFSTNDSVANANEIRARSFAEGQPHQQV